MFAMDYATFFMKYRKGEKYFENFSWCHSKLYEYIILIRFCLSSKRGEIVSFFKAHIEFFNMF